MSVQQLTKVCYKHPKEETRLSCGRCERPICTRCSIVGPAGVRCRECASLRGSTLYKVSPGRLVLAAALGLVVGIVGAEILFHVGFFMFFIGPAYGVAVAEAVSRASGRKIGPAILGIGIASIVIGFGVAIGTEWLTDYQFLAQAAGSHAKVAVGAVWSEVVDALIWPLIGAGLAISSCYARLRYM